MNDTGEVYALLNRAGEVIYVGQTTRGARARMARHRCDQFWGAEIHDIEILASGVPAGKLIAVEESEIRRRQPKYNIRANPRPPSNDPRSLRRVEAHWGYPPGTAYFGADGRVYFHHR